MEWKKENIIASELEKRQKEYLNEALSMMKKSGMPTPEAKTQNTAAPEPAPSELPETKTELGEPVKLTEEASDKLSEADTPEESATDTPEPAASPDEPTDDSDDKYGVYTADEIINGEYSGEGLKKAAEILEEMTRNTEMMKKLANGSDDNPDTTDFPDFSGSTPKDGEQFREDEETKDCTAEET